MLFAVVQIVVVTNVERRARARRPARKKLRAQSRVYGVVVKDRARECSAAELVRPAKRQNVYVERSEPSALRSKVCLTRLSCVRSSLVG